EEIEQEEVYTETVTEPLERLFEIRVHLEQAVVSSLRWDHEQRLAVLSELSEPLQTTLSVSGDLENGPQNRLGHSIASNPTSLTLSPEAFKLLFALLSNQSRQLKEWIDLLKFFVRQSLSLSLFLSFFLSLSLSLSLFLSFSLSLSFSL